MKYAMRISINTDGKGRRKAMVYLPEETQALFEKPYISVRRMQDRLAFLQWDAKTERGMCQISKGVIQYGVETDVEKMDDFVGEYDVVNKTDNGVVFVKLADRRDLVNRTYHGKREPKNIVITEVKQVNGDLAEMLEAAIADLQKQYDALEEEHVAARELLNEIAGKQGAVFDKIKTYNAALELARKGEHDGQ